MKVTCGPFCGSVKVRSSSCLCWSNRHKLFGDGAPLIILLYCHPSDFGSESSKTIFTHGMGREMGLRVGQMGGVDFAVGLGNQRAFVGTPRASGGDGLRRANRIV